MGHRSQRRSAPPQNKRLTSKPSLGAISCLLSVLALVVSATPVQAQGIGQRALPPDVLTHEPLQSGDEALIVAFAEKNLALIESGSPKEMKDAKEDLQDVARNQVVSASVRRLFSSTLLDRLNALAEGDDTPRSVVAILVMGDLGTSEAIDALDLILESEKVTRRYAAVVGYRSSFEGMAGPNAMIVGRSGAMIAKLGGMIQEEPNPLVLDMCVQTVTAASKIGAKSGLALGDVALDQLITSVSVRVRKLSPDKSDAALLEPCVKAAQNIRGIIALQVVQNIANPQIVQNAGGLCGDLLGYVFLRVRQGKLAVVGADGNLAEVTRARKPEIDATRIADELLIVCKDGLKVGVPGNGLVRTSSLIARGTKEGDQQYVREVMSIIGEGGFLTQGRFQFDSTRFLRGG